MMSVYNKMLRRVSHDDYDDWSPVLKAARSPIYSYPEQLFEATFQSQLKTDKQLGGQISQSATDRQTTWRPDFTTNYRQTHNLAAHFIDSLVAR